MQENIDNFISYLDTERNYAFNTRLAYKKDLYQLLDFLQQQHIQQWAEVTIEHLNALIINLRSHNNSARSIRRHLSSVRGFFTYLVNHDIILNNCSVGLRSPKIDKNLPKTLDYNQIELLLRPQSKSAIELRNIAIIEVIYSCALRVSELVGLNVNNIDFEGGFLQVMGKGSKMRHTPLGKAAQKALSRYLQKTGIVMGALFLNNKGQRMSVRAIELMIKKRALSVGIKVNVYPHMLRHTAATHFLQSSHDLCSVQDFLGHESIKSTQVYTHLDFLELSKVYDKCHPRAKK